MESNAVDLAGEIFLLFAGVERQLHRVIVELVAVDQHHRPLTIRTLAASAVTITFELLVRSVDGLQSFLKGPIVASSQEEFPHLLGANVFMFAFCCPGCRCRRALRIGCRSSAPACSPVPAGIVRWSAITRWVATLRALPVSPTLPCRGSGSELAKFHGFDALNFVRSVAHCRVTDICVIRKSVMKNPFDFGTKKAAQDDSTAGVYGPTRPRSTVMDAFGIW